MRKCADLRLGAGKGQGSASRVSAADRVTGRDPGCVRCRARSAVLEEHGVAERARGHGAEIGDHLERQQETAGAAAVAAVTTSGTVGEERLVQDDRRGIRKRDVRTWPNAEIPSP